MEITGNGQPSLQTEYNLAVFSGLPPWLLGISIPLGSGLILSILIYCCGKRKNCCKKPRQVADSGIEMRRVRRPRISVIHNPAPPVSERPPPTAPEFTESSNEDQYPSLPPRYSDIYPDSPFD